MKTNNNAKALKIISAATVMMMVSACSGTKSTTVAELTKYDKHMSCPELQLEITEATFLRDKAVRNRGLSVKNVVMPLSYAATYMSASEAEEAAMNRVDYLSRLHEIKGCAAQGQYAAADIGMGYGQPAYEPVAQQIAPAGYQQMRYAAQPMPAQQAMQQPRGYGAAPQYARPSYGY